VQPLVLGGDALVGKRDGLLLGKRPVGDEGGGGEGSGDGTAAEGTRGWSEHGRSRSCRDEGKAAGKGGKFQRQEVGCKERVEVGGKEYQRWF
jgi:hypothetical protein